MLGGILDVHGKCLQDLVEHIEAGVAQVANRFNPALFHLPYSTPFQHMAENVLVLLHHFTGPSSPLPTLLSTTPHKPRIVYFSLLGTWFFTYSFPVAATMYTSVLCASILLVWKTGHVGRNTQFVMAQLRGLRNFLAGLLGALLAANAVAGVMTMLGTTLTWFSQEWLPVVLYAPPAVAGLISDIHIHLHSPHAAHRRTCPTAPFLPPSTPG